MSKREDTIQQYVSDMLAVERHIHEAVRRQKDDNRLQSFPEASAVINHAEEMLDLHIAALESHLESVGGDPAAPAKEAITAALGVAAGLLDKVRTQKVSKMLRDDYTALSLAAISYHMLHTTGVALGAPGTADLALRHLKDWTPIITRISHVVHGVVAKELADDGLPVAAGAAVESERAAQEAWDPAHVS
ncbi:MAG: hypothetical protein R3272_04840 [Candidatus Promineifilaceae bacterium]|nr:hypothetical protein [Candidatus Promineifilaceae bacterium]